MPLMVTFFNVRKGRDAIFKRGMRHIFPREARKSEEKYGIRFVGWFNVTEGSTWNNVLILDLPNYAVLDQEGLSLIEQGQQVHVVITDYAMPDEDQTLVLRPGTYNIGVTRPEALPSSALPG